MNNDLNWFQDIPSDPLEDLKIDIAVKIERALDEEGLSRKQFAEKIKAPAPRVTKILSGEANLTLQTLSQIAEALKKEVRFELVNAEQARRVTINYKRSFKNTPQKQLKPITPRVLTNPEINDEMIYHV